MAYQTQLMVVLNDGASMPQFGLGVFTYAARDHGRGRQAGGRPRLSRGRHGFHVSQRGGRRRGARGPDGRLRHDEARQLRSRVRRNLPRIRRKRGEVVSPVPD